MTGSSGFIGANLVIKLFNLFDGACIIGLDNMNDYYDVSLKEYRLSQIEQAQSKSNCSFKFVKGDVLVDTLSGAIINFATYPDTIFKNSVKLIFYTIIPVGLTNYLPLHIIIKFDLVSLLTVLGVTVISVILAFVVFNKGLKSYSSSNLMSSRV